MKSKVAIAHRLLALSALSSLAWMACSSDTLTYQYSEEKEQVGTVVQALAVCGDGLVENKEKCDDGNKVAGDGCSSKCQVEDGFVCLTPNKPCRTAVCEVTKVSTSVFLKGNFIEYGLGNDGAFGSDVVAPEGYHPTGERLGFVSNPKDDEWTSNSGDMFFPGSPEEGWGIRIGGAQYNNNNNGSQQIPGAMEVEGCNIQTCGLKVGSGAKFVGSVGGLEITQRYSNPNGQLFIIIEVAMKNTTEGTINNVYYHRNVDPDVSKEIKDGDLHGSWRTNNIIVNQPSEMNDVAEVRAYGLVGKNSKRNGSGGNRSKADLSDAYDNTGYMLSLVSKDSRARVTYGGFINRDSKAIYDGAGFSVNPGDKAWLDAAISIAFNLGSFEPGETKTFSYSYALSPDAMTMATKCSDPDLIDVTKDTDGDGIPDVGEGVEVDEDTDGDGTPDYLDLDSDNDGIPDTQEAGPEPSKPLDSDSDGVFNFLDSDSDDDSLSDTFEVGENPGMPLDTDGDGIPNYLDMDSDNNGVSDLDEVGADPNNPTDTDGDGIPDFIDSDKDGDGISNVVEWGNNNAMAFDSDFDGTPDYLEVDSDNDGILDSIEVGSDPNNPVDTDEDGTPNFQDLDNDNDGLLDKVEIGMNPDMPIDSDADGKPDYLDVDSDEDGLLDVDEVGDNIDLPLDTDGDGIANYLDSDSDNDCVVDKNEDVDTGGAVDVSLPNSDVNLNCPAKWFCDTAQGVCVISLDEHFVRPWPDPAEPDTSVTVASSSESSSSSSVSSGGGVGGGDPGEDFKLGGTGFSCTVEPEGSESDASILFGFVLGTVFLRRRR